jgi:hypothetical protein
MSKKSQSYEARERRKCRSKVKYKTVQDATIASFKFLNENKTLLHVYECQWCAGLHLTSGGTNLETGQEVEFVA